MHRLRNLLRVSSLRREHVSTAARTQCSPVSAGFHPVSAHLLWRCATTELPRKHSRRFSSKGAELPSEADIVIVGGGIIGTSVAYHLAKLGKGRREVLLLERDQITSGTTWHAAGLMVTFGSMSETSTEFRKYTKELYSTILEQETGQSTGFKPCGFIELATSPDRLEEFRRVAAFNRYCGVEVEELSAQDVQDKFPLCRTDDVLAGFYVRDDGRVNPVDATMALSKGARTFGAEIVEACPVARILTEAVVGSGKLRRATGVEMADGRRIRARTVVNCAGMWARQLAETAGAVCPNQAAEHYYLITDDMPEVDAGWPVIEDPSSYTYIRPEGGGLMVGLFEPKGAAWHADRIPMDFSFAEIQADWDRMAPYLDTAMSRVPATKQVGAKTLFCGPESFTPDLGPILGEAPEVEGLFIAAGMNSIGILTGGGAGRLVAKWILEGTPDQDVTGVTPARFQAYQQTSEYRSQRVEEMLGKVYKCHYPHDIPLSARGARFSPLHHHLQRQGAFFREVGGYEMADWFASSHAATAGAPPANQLTWGRPNWFQAWAAEHRACRDGVVAMDMSFMSKFRVAGRGAGALLNWLSTANVDQAAGRITYTQWLNAGGTLEADLTVVKLAEEDFMVVASDTARRAVEAWLLRHVAAIGDVSVTDVTGSLGQINLQGPRSREVLRRAVKGSANMDAVRFRDAVWVDIGYSRVLCVRITYLGELGYELYAPAEQTAHVFEHVIAAGNGGVALAGLKALASLRLEKGYRDYGHDIDNTDPLLRTGLGFTCDFDKPGGFLGREATLQHKLALTGGAGRGPLALTLRLCNVQCLDPGVLLNHGEVLYRNGNAVGYVRAASYGHTLGGAVGIAEIGRGGRVEDGHAVVSQQYLREGAWEVEVAGRRYPAAVQLAPWYDPKNTRVHM